MLLLDAVHEFDAGRIVCLANLREDCVFARQGAVPSAVALELMAQAAAACAALEQGRAGGRRPGVLLAAREFRLCEPSLGPGVELHVVASRAARLGGTASFECSVLCREKLIASARLTVHELAEAKGGA